MIFKNTKNKHKIESSSSIGRRRTTGLAIAVAACLALTLGLLFAHRHDIDGRFRKHDLMNQLIILRIHGRLGLLHLHILAGGLLRFRNRSLLEGCLFHTLRLGQISQQIQVLVIDLLCLCVMHIEYLLQVSQHADVSSWVAADILTIILKENQAPADVVLQIRRFRQLVTEDLKQTRKEQTRHILRNHLDLIQRNHRQGLLDVLDLIQMEAVDESAGEVLIYQELLDAIRSDILMDIKGLEGKRRVQ